MSEVDIDSRLLGLREVEIERNILYFQCFETLFLEYAEGPAILVVDISSVDRCA